MFWFAEYFRISERERVGEGYTEKTCIQINREGALAI
jgi:hypothetical protein